MAFYDPIRQEEIEKIIELNKQGLTAKRISEQIGRSYPAVRKVLIAQGLMQVGESAQHKYEVNRAKIEELNSKGFSPEEIAEKIDKDITYVKGILERMGMEIDHLHLNYAPDSRPRVKPYEYKGKHYEDYTEFYTGR